MSNLDQNTKAKLWVQGLCLLTLIALAAIQAFGQQPIDKLAYAIIGGILFGVGGVRELITGRTDSGKKDDEK